MVIARLFFAVFLVTGIALLRWNRRIAEDTITANRATAQALDYAVLNRLWAWYERRRWLPVAMRATTILVGVAFVGIGILGVIVG